MNRPLLLGHRGCCGCGFLENSLAAFEFALSQGCDGFEFDVRRTRDGCNVIWHDPDYNHKQIADTNYADLLDRRGNRPITLEDVLAQFGQRAYLDIELKTSGAEETIVAALNANPPQQQGYIVSSFFPDILAHLHDREGTIPLGFLCEQREHMAAWRDLPAVVFLPRYDLIEERLIEEVHLTSRQVMTWTVNSSPQMRRLTDIGIDGLISDDPGLLYQTFHTG